VTSYLLDTHVWVWAIKLDDQLPEHIAKLLLEARAIHVSPITFYEIAQKVRVGKWPEMEPFANRLLSVLQDQDGNLAHFTGEIGQLAGLLEWNHRDPFDRMIAATSIALNLPLISADSAFDTIFDRKDWPGRVW
jgi:PIN domain nuclease of toxin-antitoxin system